MRSSPRLSSLAFLSAALVTSFVAAPALAAGPVKAKAAPQKTKPVLVAAAAEPLPPLPPPEPQPVAPVVKDEAANSAKTRVRPSAGRGFVFSLSAGLGVLTGEIAKRVDVGGAYATLEGRAGYFVTPHLGIFAGVQGGYGGLWSGCSGTCDNALSFQFPVGMEYAFADRTRGVFVDAGAAVLSTYLASTKADANGTDDSPETLTMSTPFDFKIGAGYRFGPFGSSTKDAKQSIELRLGVDFGQFKSVEYKSVLSDVDGDISDSRQAFHYVVGLSVGTSLAP
jgi:hypothetical protein